MSVDESPYTVIRAYPNFDRNPGDPGRHSYYKTLADVLLSKIDDVFEVGFELVSSTLPDVMVLY